MTIVVVGGLPGSGKSTWLRPFAQDVLSTDDIRAELTGDAADQTANARVFAILRARLAERLAGGSPVTYIDATNLTRRDRKPYIQAARKAHARVEAVWFDTSVAVCLARNRGRARQVPPHVIEAMAAKSVAPSEQEGFDSVQSFATPIANISGIVSKLTTAIPGSSKS